MKKNIKLFKVLLLVNFIILNTNCATDEVSEIERASITPTLEAKKWFDSHRMDYSASVLKYIDHLQWDNAIVSEGKIGEVIEVPFTLKENLSTSTKDGNLFNAHHRLMFIKDKQDGFKVYYVQIFSNSENKKLLDIDFNFYTIQSNFEGKVYVQDLSSTIASKREFVNGVELKPSLSSKTDVDSDMQCLWLGYWFEDGHFEALELVYCTIISTGEVLPNPNYGGGGSGSGGSGGTEGTQMVPITSEQQFFDIIDGTDASGYDITTTLMGDTRLTSVNAKITPWCWVQFVVKVERVGSVWNVINVTSTLNGNVSNVNWAQQDYGVVVNTNLNSAAVHVIGTYTNTLPMPFATTQELAYNLNYHIYVNIKTGRITTADKM